MPDDIKFFGPEVNASARRWAAVTPSDTAALPFNARAIYVGVAGNVRVTNSYGDDATFPNVPAGAVLPVWGATRIMASTTASGLVIMQ